MQMVAPYRIQAFPPGMILPSEANVPAAAREGVEPAVQPTDDVSSLVRRRDELIRQLGELRSHSHRRVALQARLDETTRRLLVLECRR